MTFSYSLVVALFLLAPGFASFAALFMAGRTPSLHPAPPPPNSVLTLAFVTLAALALHAALASLFAVQDLLAHLTTWRTPFEPNPYSALLQAGEKGAGQTAPGAQAANAMNGGEAAVVLIWLVLLSAAGFALTKAFVEDSWAQPLIRQLLYGWTSDIISQSKGVTLTNAFVLTRIEGEAIAFGYEGMLRAMTLGVDKEILSIVLDEVTAFSVTLKDGEFKRAVIGQTRGIPNLYIPKEDIRNVSFTTLELTADAVKLLQAEDPRGVVGQTDASAVAAA